MEKSYMRPDTLVELEFIYNRSTDTHWHENYELMFVVSGSMDFTVEQDVYHLDSREQHYHYNQINSQYYFLI